MTAESVQPLPSKASLAAWRAPVPWRARQSVRIHVLMHQHFVASIVIVGFVALLLLVPVIIATLLLAEIDRLLALVLIITAGPVLGGLLLWANARLWHRTAVRPASAAEVTALRMYSSAQEWAHVQAAAIDWRASRPRTPITINVILRWRDEASKAEQEAMPPTVVEQAASRSQARAFE